MSFACCSQSQSTSLVEEKQSGDRTCVECERVAENRAIDQGAQWRKLSSETSSGSGPCRVEKAEKSVLNGSNLTIQIGRCRGKTAVDENGKAKYKENTTFGDEEGVLTKSFSDIFEMGGQINATNSIIDEACRVFKTAYEKKIVKGKSTDAIAATCLFIACRNKNDPRTIKEVCAVSRTSKKKFWKIYKKISPVVDIGVINPTAGDFIPRFCSKLRLSNEILKAALAISTAANTLCLATNRRASSVAAGVIYMASSLTKEKQTLTNVSETVGIAKFTIKVVYKELCGRALDLVPEGFAPKKLIEKLENEFKREI